VWYRELFVSAALAMVFFTVFVQGSTIKLLVKCLNIQLEKDKDGKLCTDIQVLFHLLFCYEYKTTSIIRFFVIFNDNFFAM
jgi:hypothetical protein